MSGEIVLLCMTVASIGFFHTLFGVDHYLPFIAMSRARQWSLKKTLFLTFLCGLGHVGSSIVIGFLGIAIGIGVRQLEPIEQTRGLIAAWLLLAAGLVYMVWGLKQAVAGTEHSHRHQHGDAQAHEHRHHHLEVEHKHVHGHKLGQPSLTAWTLFTIFVLGPCEPLIPILMYPTATHSTVGLFWVTGLFAFVTVGTMTCLVGFGYMGLQFLQFRWMERYMHAIAGGVIACSGAAIVFLGL